MEGFGEGLLRASGVEKSTLDLNGKMGGSKEVALATVAQMMPCLTEIKCVSNRPAPCPSRPKFPPPELL